MLSSLRSVVNKIIGYSEDESIDSSLYFEYSADRSGLNFFLPHDIFKKLVRGEKRPYPAIAQYIALTLLEEQGLAERMPNGFRAPSDVIAALDKDDAVDLNLPPLFNGCFVADISGHTNKSNFQVRLQIKLNEQNHPFKIKGPLLYLGSSPFRLSSEQLLAFQALEQHKQLSSEQKTAEQNLRLMAVLQAAVRSGMILDLGHFDTLDVSIPDQVSVTAEKLPDGSLQLAPCLGSGLDADLLNKRWHQIDTSANGGVLRIEDRIVLLEEKTMQGVNEVLSNRRIPADKVKEFIQSPTAFLNAALVNLDIGFSVRVLGVGKLQLMDFGGLDDQKTDWFAREVLPAPPEAITKLVETQDDFNAIIEKLDIARDQGAELIQFQDEWIDISDQERVEEALGKASSKMADSFVQESEREKREAESTNRVSVILKDAEEINASLLDEVASKKSIAEPDWEQYARAPFPHQKEGVIWLKSLIDAALKADHDELYRVQGGLLADDMGLGKTYMTLVAVNEYLQLQRQAERTEKPILVVAPLSLLENWEQEISNTFKNIPFKDIKVLQSSRDLKEFKVSGSIRESVQMSDAIGADGMLDNNQVRYALKVGPEAGSSRLDIDRRLVLTTYQTLRDYQLSLCLIDWGVVIFDEAQNIKNPNTIQSRAAKGLKADFKLLATGTPVENSLGDFWCLMDTAQPGLLGDWQQFKERWLKPIAQADEADKQLAKQTIGAELRAAVGCYMLRRVKEDQLADLPEKRIYTGVSGDGTQGVLIRQGLAAYMRGLQLERYDSVLTEHKASQYQDNPQHALTALRLLRAVSLHPRLADEDNTLMTAPSEQVRSIMEESVKLKILLHELDQIRQRDEKVILFMVTKKLQKLLKVWLQELYGLNIHIINGDTAAVQNKKDILTRKSMIEEFESVEGFNIIIMSPVAAGVGLTVVGANNVIHLERHWNPAKEAQATDRVYRIGQQKAVNILLPMALHPEYDSFDIHLNRLLSNKLTLKDAVVVPEVVSESEMAGLMGI